MALVTTISEVIGVLVGMAVLLWLSASIESRQLGPAGERSEDPAAASMPAEGPVASTDAMSPAA